MKYLPKSEFVSAKEIFEKCWALTFGNSIFFEQKDSKSEVEMRQKRIGDLYIYCEIIIDNINPNKISKSCTISKNKIDFVISDYEISNNKRFLPKDNDVFNLILNLFEKHKNEIKLIKQLQKKLIIETTNLQKKLGIAKL